MLLAECQRLQQDADYIDMLSEYNTELVNENDALHAQLAEAQAARERAERERNKLGLTNEQLLSDSDAAAFQVNALHAQLVAAEQRCGQLQAQVETLTKTLTELAQAADCETCIAKSPIGCAGDRCAIQQIKTLLASLPAAADCTLRPNQRASE
jgi:chromosome segregation ATPase